MVERTFGWIMRRRRLVCDYERRYDVSEAMIHISMATLLIRRSPLPNDMLMREHFNRYRQGHTLSARILGTLVTLLDSAAMIPLRRVLDLRTASHHAINMRLGDVAISLRELQGVVGTY